PISRWEWSRMNYFQIKFTYKSKKYCNHNQINNISCLQAYKVSCILFPSKRNIDAADGTTRRASQEDRLLI
ncbi:TPA: hypothetical protein ACVHP4_004425, partial [Yersinia enterocolitica]